VSRTVEFPAGWGASLEASLARDPGVGALLRSTAQKAKVEARQIARRDRDTGHYENSIKVDGTTLYTDDIAGHIFEYGSITDPPRAALRRAAEAVGATVVDDGR